MAAFLSLSRILGYIMMESLSDSKPGYPVISSSYCNCKRVIMRAEQKVKIWPVLITTLQAMSWACATSRSFPNAAAQGSTTQIIEPDWKPKREIEEVDTAAFRGMGGIGSRPPSCNKKCGGCAPCEAVQVPTITGHLGVQYANYEPEGWKCKCGASVYNP